MSKKISFNDFGNFTPKEIMKKYNVNARQMEQQLSSHLYGATRKETQEMYHTVYDAKEK